jgi:Transposase, Mutator family
MARQDWPWRSRSYGHAPTASTAPFTACATCWRAAQGWARPHPFNYWSALTDATSIKDGKLRLQVLISELEHAGCESVRCLTDDLDALVVHLRYPLRHRERWRSTNLLERSLGEVRRRTKVIGRFPGETSCLTLIWAVLDLSFSHASNGATFTDVDPQHLYRIKYQQTDPDTIDEEVTAA